MEDTVLRDREPDYEAYDPAEFSPPGPPTLNDPSVEAEPHPPDGGFPVPEFDPRLIEEFEGLLFVGALKARFVWFGHTFVIRTLHQGELLDATLVCKPWIGTQGDWKAYVTAIVAACIVSVDGRELPIPLVNEVHESLLEERFNYVNSKWFPPTVDVVYDRWLLLEAKVNEIMEAAGKVSG